MSSPDDPDDLAAQIAPHVAAIIKLLVHGAGRDDADLIPLAEAARMAKTSTRVVRDAIRDRQLAAYGRQRDRSVRRRDLDAWIESRRVVHAPIDDKDLQQRMDRLARGRRKAKTQTSQRVPRVETRRRKP